MSRASKPAAGLVFRAPARWHTDAVAVHRLAATASKIAFSISLPLRQAWPPNQPDYAGTGRLLIYASPGSGRPNPG
jgi:hypothetical protein